MDKIVVFGGTGFVGSSICKQLAGVGYEVVSISKSGQNKYLFERDCEHIRFVKADLFQTSAWAAELDGCLVVVNCIGILFQNRAESITYQRLIFETTRLIADAAEAKGVSSFVHISAIKPPSFVLQEYHRYKQEAEKFLQARSFNLLIIRPRIIVSAHKPFFLFLYKMQELLHFPWKQFEPIEGVAAQVVDFLQTKKQE